MQLLFKVGDMLTLQFLKKLLLGAGLGLTSFTGVISLMNSILRDSTSSFYRGDSAVLQILGLGGVDISLSMIISACFVRATMSVGSVVVSKL